MILKTINSETVVCPKKDQEIRISECKQCNKHKGFQNMYREIVCHFKQFEIAEEVREIARDIISEHHKHLVEAKILYLFRNGTWKVNRKTRWGTAEKCGGKVNFITGYDFIVTVNGDVWPQLDLKARQALIDHELCHCGRGEDDEDGNPTWCIEPHTVEDFAAVVRRHGLWAEDLKMVNRALDEHKVQQVSMFAGGDNVYSLPGDRTVVNQ